MNEFYFYFIKRPVGVFIWNVVNLSEKDRKVSVTFTWKNGTGNKKQDNEGNSQAKSFEQSDLRGCTINQNITGMQCNYSICAKTGNSTTVTTCHSFDPISNGEKIWTTLKDNGFLNEGCVDKNLKSKLLNTTLLIN